MAGIVAVAGVAIFLLADRGPGAPAFAAASNPATRAAAARVVADAPLEAAAAPVFAARDVSREGIAAYGRGDIAGSLEQFEAAVEAHPGNADALNNLGQVLVRTGRPREAIPYFDRAIEASGGVWAYRFNRARAYGQLEQWPLAISGYRDAAALFPDDYVTQFNLAKALEANRDLDAAVDAYARAIALAPGQTEFHLSHARSLEAARRPAEAAAAYRRYLELEESAPQADKIRARIAELERGSAAPSPQAP
jgi:tetratricopeptide (TPR) repeat protein